MSGRMPLDFATPVVRNVDLGRGHYLIEFEDPGIGAAMRPAQFFMIGIPGSDVLLRRPFSVCGLPGTFEDTGTGTLQVLFRVYGRATSLLAALRPGAALQVLGPLGNGFALPERRETRIVLVAGGIGVAPFPAFLVEALRAGYDVSMIYGARSGGDLPLLDWFRARCEVTVTTDDGSAGTRGLVVAPLTERLGGPERHRTHVYACGPSPMLRAVARLSNEAGTVCDLSLEAPMACGFGVCLGCVVPTHGERPGESRYERVCVEGPVMRSTRMAW
jgi:dihydroorotate dehydrogenase electron transfer subunit